MRGYIFTLHVKLTLHHSTKLHPTETRRPLRSLLFLSRLGQVRKHGHRRFDHSRRVRVRDLGYYNSPRVHSAACRQPVIQSGYTSFPPAYPLLHIDALNNELSKASRTGTVDPVIYVPPGIGDFSGGSACCHVEVGELRLIASVSGDGEGHALCPSFPIQNLLHDSRSSDCIRILASI